LLSAEVFFSQSVYRSYHLSSQDVVFEMKYFANFVIELRLARLYNKLALKDDWTRLL